MSTFSIEALVEDAPVFFLHKNAASRTMDISNLEIDKYYKTPDEITEWEQIMLREVGLKIDGNALIAAGGSCCGTKGGMSDAE